MQKETPEVLSKFSISYLRVSTAIQTNETKTGITRQEKAYRKWQAQHPEFHPWEKGFKDLGVSGRGTHRTKGALSLFLDKARRNEIPPQSCLVVENVSRLTRDEPFDALKLCIEIFDLGHSLSFCAGKWGGQIIKSDGHGVWSSLIASMEAASAEWEDKSARVNEYHAEKLERIKNGDLRDFRPRTKDREKVDYPFWLDLVQMKDRSKNYFVHNDQAKYMTMMFDLALEVGNEEISKILFTKGRPAINNEKRRLCRSTIGGYLKSRAVLGEFQPQKDGGSNRAPSVPGVWPPLVTPEQFEAVQKKRATRIRNQDYGVSPTPKIHNLFRGAIFCRECQSKCNPAQNSRLNKSGGKSHFQYLYCSSGYRGAEDICSCKKRLTTLKAGVDIELEILKRLQTFRWAEFFTDEKHEVAIKSAKGKLMRRLEKRNNAEGSIKKFKEAEIDYFEQGRAVPIELEELKSEAQKTYDSADMDYNLALIELNKLKGKERGFEADRKIKKRLKAFLKDGRNNIQTRKEFSRWFLEMGLAIDIDLRTGLFDIGIGTVEKNVLVELDMALEHISMFMRDGFTFVDEEGKALDMNHFIKNKDIQDSKSKEQKIKESWEWINNPKNLLLQKAIVQHLHQLPKDSSEARNIRANLEVA